MRDRALEQVVPAQLWGTLPWSRARVELWCCSPLGAELLLVGVLLSLPRTDDASTTHGDSADSSSCPPGLRTM